MPTFYTFVHFILRAPVAGKLLAKFRIAKIFLGPGIAEVPPKNCSNTGFEFGARFWGGCLAKRIQSRGGHSGTSNSVAGWLLSRGDAPATQAPPTGSIEPASIK
jgi:hypothetical protein